MDKEY